MSLKYTQYNDVTTKLTLTSKDADTGEVTPINLTGCTVKVYIAKTLNSEILITKTITSHTDAVEGITTLELSNEDLALDVGNYKIEFRLIDTNLKETTLSVSDLSILPVINKA